MAPEVMHTGRFFLYNINFSSYSLWLPFLTGIVAGLAIALLLYNRHQRNRDRAGNVNLNTTRKVLQRYRQLVEGSSDILFIMDFDGMLLYINRAVYTTLHYQVDDMIGKNLLDFAYKNEQENIFFNRHIIMDNLLELISGKKRCQFQADLTTYNKEPCHLLFHLEAITQQDEEGAPSLEQFILGRASFKTEDALEKLCLSESQYYELPNKLTQAELVADRITSKVYRYIDEESANGVRLGVRETLVNAIEHGNLAITFDEKSKAKEQGSYLELMRSRQNNSLYRDKKTKIRYQIDQSGVEYIIEDEGKGFDHKKMLARDLTDDENQWRSHGRGLILTVHQFDRVEYNEPGNSVHLVKKFNNSKTDPEST